MCQRSAPDDALHAEVVVFLGNAATHGVGLAKVDRVETHGAIVFLAGEHAYKIKRNVRYSYMNFSTSELRRRACLRELEVNRPHAPGLYLGVVAITREPDGRLAIDGSGTPVEWAVWMRRFGDDALLSCIAERYGIDASLARAIADAVHDYHRGSPVPRLDDQRSQLGESLRSWRTRSPLPAFRFAPGEVRQLTSSCRLRLDSVAEILARRSDAGLVRRCHGDLHLGNIVMWQGRPTLFDAIEFDEALATIDTLYDLAFLLMDLDRRGQRAAANIVLNRYLWRTQALLDLEGLAALPLFLALRAGIRAMVTAQRAELVTEQGASEARSAAAAYLSAAIGYLDACAAAARRRRRVVGNREVDSGSGARADDDAGSRSVAPAQRSRAQIDARCGGDRAAAGVMLHGRGQPRVYDLLAMKARTALAAGHSVIVDAVYLAPDERSALGAGRARPRRSVRRGMAASFGRDAHAAGGRSHQ